MNHKITEVNLSLLANCADEFIKLINKFYEKTKETEGKPEDVFKLCNYAIINKLNYWKVYFVFGDDFNLVGYSISYLYTTMLGTPSCCIWQGYLDVKYNNTGITEEVLDKTEKWAKMSGAKDMAVITTREDKSYEKWISKFGYNRKMTMFVKGG